MEDLTIFEALVEFKAFAARGVFTNRGRNLWVKETVRNGVTPEVLVQIGRLREIERELRQERDHRESGGMH